MVGDAVLNMNILEVFQTLTGKILALKTPAHPVLPGAVSKTSFAFDAGDHDLIRVTPAAANLFGSKTHFLSPLVELL